MDLVIVALLLIPLLALRRVASEDEQVLRGKPPALRLVSGAKG
jgi:hypothetical protein